MRLAGLPFSRCSRNWSLLLHSCGHHCYFYIIINFHEGNKQSYYSNLITIPCWVRVPAGPVTVWQPGNSDEHPGLCPTHWRHLTNCPLPLCSSFFSAYKIPETNMLHCIYHCYLQSLGNIYYVYQIDSGNKKEGEGFPGGPMVKNLPANAEDTGLITGPGRFHMPWSK